MTSPTRRSEEDRNFTEAIAQVPCFCSFLSLSTGALHLQMVKCLLYSVRKKVLQRGREREQSKSPDPKRKLALRRDVLGLGSSLGIEVV